MAKKSKKKVSKKAAKKKTVKKVSKSSKKVKKKPQAKKASPRKSSKKLDSSVLDLTQSQIKRQMAPTDNRNLKQKDRAIVVDRFDETEEDMEEYFDDNYEDGEYDDDEPGSILDDEE